MDNVAFIQMKDGTGDECEFINKHEITFTIGKPTWCDGADIDWVIAAFLHDIGDIYAPYNPDEYAGAASGP